MLFHIISCVSLIFQSPCLKLGHSFCSNRACTHDESEIQALRDKVRELQNSLLKTKIDVEKKEETCREYDDKVGIQVFRK